MLKLSSVFYFLFQNVIPTAKLACDIHAFGSSIVM